MNALITLFTVALWVMPSSAQAGSAPKPANPCLEGSRCTEEMINIFDEFENSRMYPNQDEFPLVFSGRCHVLRPGFDATLPVHNLIVFDLDERGGRFHGVTSFFSPENPYVGLNYGEALDRVKRAGSQGTDLLPGDDFSWVEYEYPNSMLNYWFRIDPKNGDLLVLKRFLFIREMVREDRFCRLHIH